MNLEVVAQQIRPSLVIDVGANVGHWAREARALWSQAEFFLIEANRECEAMLQESGMKYRIAVLSDTEKTVEFFTRRGAPTCTGASYLREQTEFYAGENAIATTVQTLRLDDLFEQYSLEAMGPILLKMDTQGSELDILKGAPRVLAATTAIIIEVAHTDYNQGAPHAAAVDAYLTEHGFINVATLSTIVHPISREHIQNDILYIRK